MHFLFLISDQIFANLYLFPRSNSLVFGLIGKRMVFVKKDSGKSLLALELNTAVHTQRYASISKALRASTFPIDNKAIISELVLAVLAGQLFQHYQVTFSTLIINLDFHVYHIYFSCSNTMEKLPSNLVPLLFLHLDCFSILKKMVHYL